MSRNRSGRFRRPILLVLTMLLAFTATFAYALERNLNTVPGAEDSGAGGPAERGTPNQSLGERQSSVQPGLYRFLLCGADDAAGLTDVILYGVLDTQNDRINLLQIPRDTFVGTAYASGKINAVCNQGGTEPPVLALCELLEEQFALPVDYYAVITLDTVRAMVDSLGGVTVDVPQRIDYLPGKVLEPGVQTLDGEKAEWLIRYRKGYAMGDLGRLGTQQLFLQAMFHAVAQKSNLQLALLAAQYFDKIDTNVSMMKGLDFALSALSIGLDKLDIYTIEGYAAQYGPYTVMVPYRQKLTELLNENFRARDSGVDYLALPGVPQPQTLPYSSEASDSTGGDEEQTPPVQWDESVFPTD